MPSDLPTIAEIRENIDEADEIILRALAARMKCAKHLKILKDQMGLKIADPKREEALKAQWKKRAAELGFAPELALMILDFILSESRRIQEAS